MGLISLRRDEDSAGLLFPAALPPPAWTPPPWSAGMISLLLQARGKMSGKGKGGEGEKKAERGNKDSASFPGIRSRRDIDRLLFASVIAFLNKISAVFSLCFRKEFRKLPGGNPAGGELRHGSGKARKS